MCALACYLAPSRWTTPILAIIGFASALWVFPGLGISRGKNFWIAYYGYYFFAGASLYVWRDWVPLHAGAALALTATWVASFHSPLYPLAEALLLPYAVVWIAFARRTARPLSRAWPPLAIPDISYGLYIYGFPVQQTVSLLYGRSLPFAACLALSIAGTTVMATLSWYLVEKPCLRLKSRVLPSPL